MTAMNIANLVRTEAAPTTTIPVNIATATAQPAPPETPASEALPTSEIPAAPKSPANRIEALLVDVREQLLNVQGDGFITVVASKVVQLLMSEDRLKYAVEQVMAEMTREKANANLPVEIPAGIQEALAAAVPAPTPDVPVEADPSLVFTVIANPTQHPFDTLLVFSPTIGADLSPSSIDVSVWSVDDHGDTHPTKLTPSYHAALLAYYKTNSAQFGFGQHYVVQMGLRKPG